MAKTKTTIKKRPVAKQKNKQVNPQRTIKHKHIGCKSNKKTTNTIKSSSFHSLIFTDKEYLTIHNKIVPENDRIDIIKAIQDIAPCIEEETKNLSFSKEDSPEEVFQKIIDEIQSNYTCELLLRKYDHDDEYFIEQAVYFDVDQFYLIPIKEMLMACEGHPELIANFLITIKYLSFKYDIRYEPDLNFVQERLEENLVWFKNEGDEERVKQTLADLYEIRFGFLRSVYDTIDSIRNFDLFVVKGGLNKRQQQVYDWTIKAYNEVFYSPFDFESEDGNGETPIVEIVRFVWSIKDDVLGFVQELEDSANNFGVIYPRFSNRLTATSKSVDVPKNFINLLDLMNYDRIKSTIEQL